MNFEFFNNLVDEFIISLVMDFKNPVIQKQLLREINALVNQIENPIIRTIASNYVEEAIEYIKNKTAPFIQDVVLSDPPKSIDVSSKVIKETIDNKIDSITEKIKKELEQSKGESNGSTI